ncbi:MAG: hypothetical protein DMF73_01010 [Acidobacteria bacterium]|nr:MAG: hypothetical protein DMF73_01010 [Acidobacteriota bacterium]
MIFAFRKESRYHQPLSGKVINTKENRFYFSNDKLIKWIRESGTHAATDSTRSRKGRANT